MRDASEETSSVRTLFLDIQIPELEENPPKQTNMRAAPSQITDSLYRIFFWSQGFHVITFLGWMVENTFFVCELFQLNIVCKSNKQHDFA